MSEVTCPPLSVAVPMIISVKINLSHFRHRQEDLYGADIYEDNPASLSNHDSQQYRMQTQVVFLL
jgi:hypothetical protein